MNSGLQDAPDYARLMNEIRDLKEKNRQLQQQVSETKRRCPMIMPGTRTNSNAWPNLSNTSSTPTGL